MKKSVKRQNIKNYKEKLSFKFKRHSVVVKLNLHTVIFQRKPSKISLKRVWFKLFGKLLGRNSKCEVYRNYVVLWEVMEDSNWFLFQENVEMCSK